ncbi:histidine phosphatase family protein [Streptomyces sp. WAC00263]|uniref:histidine phosphatase family protein n=1 Tax=Streptomyces sp. WAC00263 TaxID=1917422 RepID=UPI0015EE8C9B|nr:histidine phosphatase family protein [Streptomyces sp. WAC00263]KAF5990691.1 histidine phosphatase family protein [Streptomyces sp. WAC00263]
MAIRLTLLTPAPSPALREARVDDDGPLDEHGRQQARAAIDGLPPADRHLTAPSRQCRETADALGLDPAVDVALRAIDLGTWRGRTFDELAAADPTALAAWTTNPAAAPHGGESVQQLCGRIADWHAFWRIDLRPLAHVHLTGRARRWNLRLE